MFLGDAPPDIRNSIVGKRRGGRDTWGPESRMMGPKDNIEHRDANPKTDLVLEVSNFFFRYCQLLAR
jgi:hypothetical protein